MEHNKNVRFGDICFRSAERFYPGRDGKVYECIELEHIESETGRIVGKITSEDVSSTKNIFRHGDILFSKLRPYLRKYALPDSEGICSSEIWVLKPRKGVDPVFLYYLVQTEKFISHANKSSGSKMPRADWDLVQEIPFNIPELVKQQKIAACLSTWDAAIEAVEEQIELATKKKKALMQKLLTGKERLPGFEGEWTSREMRELGSTYPGLTGKTKDDFGAGSPYITYINVFRNSAVKANGMGYVRVDKSESQSTTKYGDIIFTTSSEVSAEVGMSSVVLDDAKGVYLNSFCFGFRPSDLNELIPEFMEFYFRGQCFRKMISSLAQGSTRFNLSKVNFMKLNISLPAPDEQKAIALVLNAFESEIEALSEKLKNIELQKKSLMQQLLG